MKFITFLAIFFVLFSCQNTPHSSNTHLTDEMGMHDYSEVAEEESMRSAANRDSKTTAPPPSAEPNKSIDEKIIKNGFVQMDVMDIKSGKNRIDQLITNVNAYYENEEYHHSDYQSTFTLNIRIPADQFESFIQQLEAGEGTITSKNISSRNVTEQFIDLEIRKENKEAYLAQYHELIKKAANVKDLLEIQERIRRLSEEIEATKGRLRYLTDQVGYSTLHLTLTQKHDQVLARTPFNLGERLKNAGRSGVEAALSFLVGIVAIWPFIIGIVFLFLFRGKIFSLFKR